MSTVEQLSVNIFILHLCNKAYSFNLAAPSKPSLATIAKNSTAITMRITPSADDGGDPVTYTLYYRLVNGPQQNTPVQVGDVAQNQTLSPLQSEKKYYLFVKVCATNCSTLQKDSAIITVVTTTAGEYWMKNNIIEQV